MGKSDLKFKEREAKKILKLAIKNKYSPHRQEERGQLQTIGLSELSELAKGADIRQENLDKAVKDYQKNRSKRKERLKGLAKIAAVAVGIGLGGLGGKAIYSSFKEDGQSVNATVLSAKQGEGSPCSNYTIQFRTRDNNTYNADVICQIDQIRYRLKRETLREGSEIAIKRGDLSHQFDKNSPNVFAGILGYNSIEILKP